MPKFGNLVVDQLIVPVGVWFFFIGGVVAVVVAAGLILRHPGVFRLFGVMNHYVSTRRMGKPLSVPRDSSGFFWKHRWPVAAVFTVGAAYSLYGLIALIDNAVLVSALRLSYRPVVVLWAVESIRLILIVGCAVSLVVGLVLGFFPDTMRVLEAHSARWFSTRRLAPEVDAMNSALDNWVAAYPRVAGSLIIIPALAVAFVFGTLLLGR